MNGHYTPEPIEVRDEIVISVPIVNLCSALHQWRLAVGAGAYHTTQCLEDASCINVHIDAIWAMGGRDGWVPRVIEFDSFVGAKALVGC